jgi:hypothetical protein
MVTLEEMIKTEIKDRVGHEPTALEIQSCSEYLAACEIKWLVDVELAVLHWKNEKTVKCAWCEERYLPEEMISTAGNECFCCDQCKHDYKQEHGVAECGMD